MQTLVIILTVLAVAALYIFVLPKRLDGTFTNAFLQLMHNFFHFKKLFLESILKFTYVASTIYVMFLGFFSIFIHNRYTPWWVGLVTMIAGPVILRIVYELLMMTILLVQNVIEINRKLGKKNSDN